MHLLNCFAFWVQYCTFLQNRNGRFNITFGLENLNRNRINVSNGMDNMRVYRYGSFIIHTFPLRNKAFTFSG